MEAIIRTEHLSKHYGSLKAVDDVSVNVSRGEIYGFLGLNGAGKTTTIRMILGMAKPDSGVTFLNGLKVSPGNLQIWSKVGYLVELPYSYPDLTVTENLEIIRRLRHIEGKKSVEDIIGRMKLSGYRDIVARNLSLGNKQRLGLAKALIHNPGILILDEPANGLDPEGIIEIRELLKDLARNNGVTVLVSSHILGEISRFATRIGIIHEGRLIYESSAGELESLRKKVLKLRTGNPFDTSRLLANSGLHPVINNDGVIELSDPQAMEGPEKIAVLLVTAGYPPSLLQVEEEDLEAFFLRVINKTTGITGG